MDRIRATALPVLTKTAQYSAPFIATFLLIHLSAPAMANLGGSSLASSTMLLGREYYQTALSEPFLVLGPIAVHAFSGILKRLLSPPDRPPRRFTHLLSLTGYAAFFFFLPIHYLTHRAYPAIDAPPIDGVGPAELDFEFVKTGLKGWPIRSWFLYGGLVLSVTLHLVDGMTLIWNNWLKDSFSLFSKRLESWRRETRPRRMLLALSCIVLPTMTGLYALAREPVMTYSSMAQRYQAVFFQSLLYRL